MLLTWASASRGYSTAARALVGKSYAPSAPRTGQGTPDPRAAEGLRLAVDVGRGARGQKARALLISTHTPRGSAVFSSHACPARSSDAAEEVAPRQCCVLASLALHAGLSRASLSLSFLSLSLSHSFSMRMRTGLIREARVHTHTNARTEWHACWNGMRWNDTDTMMVCTH